VHFPRSCVCGRSRVRRANAWLGNVVATIDQRRETVSRPALPPRRPTQDERGHRVDIAPPLADSLDPHRTGKVEESAGFLMVLASLEATARKFCKIISQPQRTRLEPKHPPCRWSLLSPLHSEIKSVHSSSAGLSASRALCRSATRATRRPELRKLGHVAAKVLRPRRSRLKACTGWLMALISWPR